MEGCRQKETHRAYTLDFKLAVVDWLHSHSASYRAAAKQFGVDRKMVREWVERREYLRTAIIHHGPNKKKLHQGRKPFSPDLDKAVLEYLLQERAEGRSVLDRQLTSKALEYSHCLGLDSNFKATSQWLKRWKRRVRVIYKDGSNQYDPVDIKLDCSDVIRPSENTILSHVSAGDEVESQDSIATLQIVVENEADNCNESAVNIHPPNISNDHSYCKDLEAEKLLQYDETLFEFSDIPDQSLSSQQGTTESLSS